MNSSATPKMFPSREFIVHRKFVDLYPDAKNVTLLPHSRRWGSTAGTMMHHKNFKDIINHA